MFAVRDVNNIFTEAHYDNLNDLYIAWWRELTAKTHHFVRINV